MKNVIIRGRIQNGQTTIKVCLFWRGRWEIWHNFSAPSDSAELKEFVRGLDYEIKELSRH